MRRLSWRTRQEPRAKGLEQSYWASDGSETPKGHSSRNLPNNDPDWREVGRSKVKFIEPVVEKGEYKIEMN